MGTRGLTKVIHDGKAVVAQYGQWDHYPSGQGLTALRFLRDPRNVEGLRYAAAHLHTATAEEVKNAWTDAGADPDHDWVTMEVSAVFRNKHPEFSRDTGAEILALVASGQARSVYLDEDFEKDTLFCEGVAEVNLDTDEFIWRYPGYKRDTVEYRFPLSDLPTDDEFIKTAEPEDD